MLKHDRHRHCADGSKDMGRKHDGVTSQNTVAAATAGLGFSWSFHRVARIGVTSQIPVTVCVNVPSKSLGQ